MRKNKFTESGLGGYHPLVSFCYFVCIIGFSLLFIHPIYAYLSILCAALHAIQLTGKKAGMTLLLFALPTWLLMVIANPIFNHHGATYLFYWNDNPITMEACIYGLVAAGMMVACMLWFFCYNEVVTSDKFLDIFGRIVPTAALIASMTLRLIPKLVGQIKTIADSQSTMGLTVTSGSLWHRAKSCARILSILVTWALEDAVITSDSMHARGYGSRKRTHFTPFVFCRRDLRMLALIGALALLSLAAYVLRIGRMLYYPVLNGLRYDGVAIVCYAAFLLLGLLPVIITAREDAKWKFLELKR